MQFSLNAGLQIRKGERLLQLVRHAADGDLVFEDISTKLPSVIKHQVLMKDIWAGKINVVWSTDGREGEQSQEKEAKGPTDYSTLSEKDQALLEYRLSYVRAVRRRKIARGQRRAIEQVIQTVAASQSDKKPPSASTVMLWMRRFEKNDLDPSTLLTKHSSRKRTSRADPMVEEILWKVLREEYFTRAKHSATHAFSELARRLRQSVHNGTLNKDQARVSYSTFCRRIKEVDLYHRLSTRVGQGYARAQCRTAFPGSVPTYPLERVEIDHTPLNWIIVCDKTGLPLGRPTLSMALDGATSYPLGFYVSFYGPGLSSVAGVIRNSVMPKRDMIEAAGLQSLWLDGGLGDMYVLDNGLEFHARSFLSMALALGVDLMFCRVRTPWLKPHVERFFATLNTLTLARGRISKAVANVLRIDPGKDAVITFSDFIKGLLQFLVEVYPHLPNWRKMATSFELFQDGIGRMPPAVYPGSWEEFKLASGMSKELTLGQGGIEFYGVPYGSYAFKDVVKKHGYGKVLCKWDPDDISQLYFRHPVEQKWHTATSRWPHYTTGLSFNQHKLIRTFARANMKSPDREDALFKARQDLHDHWLDATSKRSRADSQLAGRFSGLTSANVFTPSASTPTPMRASMVESSVVLAEHLPFNMNDVPEFEGFVL